MCDICNSKNPPGNRRRVGPTGRRFFMILVDSCYACGAIYPVEPNRLSYHEARWVERYNKRMKINYLENEPNDKTDPHAYDDVGILIMCNTNSTF